MEKEVIPDMIDESEIMDKDFDDDILCQAVETWIAEEENDSEILSENSQPE